MSFSKKDEEMLIDIFSIFAPSRKEEKMVEYIEEYLKKIGVPFIKDEHGNIFNLTNKDRPLLSSHMDSVGDADCGFVNMFINIFDYRNDRILRGMGNIGGDDKCGIFIILKKLEEDKTLNFIFSLGEEIGCVGINQVIPKNSIDDLPYALVLDRRGYGDIICLQNSYGNFEFEKALHEVGKDFSFSPTRGSISDSNTICKYINCANLSVGYHNPHTKKEYVSLLQLENTLNYVTAIIKNFETKKFEKPKVVVYAHTSTNAAWSGKDYDYGYDDYGFGKDTGKYKNGFYEKNFYCPVCKGYKLNEKKVILNPKPPKEFVCSDCAARLKKLLV